MSSGIGMTTILGCLRSGEPLMGVTPSGWVSVGGVYQDFFAVNQLKWRPGLEYFKGETLRSFAHYDPKEVERVKQDWGMRTPKMPVAPGGIYMISQLREMMKWVVKGETVDSFDWPTFWVHAGVEFLGTKVSREPVIRVMTLEGDYVYLMRADKELRGMEILFEINRIMANLETCDREYDGVQAPFVYADLNPDLSWLLGLKNKGWFVAYVQQKILFGMNDEGFAVREETDMITMKASLPGRKVPYIVSPDGEPFYFWRTRTNVPFYLSVFQFTSGDFKDPGDLKAIIA